MKESQLYLYACYVALLSFLICAYYISYNHTISYQNTVIMVLCLLSLSKSIVYYEKHIFKLTTNH